MTTFEEREKAAEGKFARDEEAQFLARARRDRLVGQWAGAKLGLNSAETEAYGQALVLVDVEHFGDADVIARLKADFTAKQISITEQQIIQVLHEKMIEAEKLIKAAL